jgi:GNAT superfamily N-acetyltransferase
VHYELRDITPQDRDFLWELHRTTMKGYVEGLWGWDEAQQKRLFDDWFKSTKGQIITVDGESVGRLEITIRDADVLLDTIEIAPKMQRSGLGSEIIRQTLAKARAMRLPLILSVLRSNPAKVLYERLGFVVTSADGERYWFKAS